MMLKRIKHYIFQAISFIFVIYGFYLLFLFLLDTSLRVNKTLAYPFSIGITLLLASFTFYYWVKKGRLPL